MEKNDKQYTNAEFFGRQANPWLVGIATTGLLAIVVATMIPLFSNGFEHPWFRYLYAAGAALVLIGRLFSPYTGKHPRVKRLYRLEAWSGIFFAVAAFFMFYDPSNNRDWLAFTLAGGAIQIVVTLIMSRVAKRDLKK